jgi:hypothetical protein
MHVTQLVGEPEIWASMCRRFPWITEERGEIAEGLIHLDFAALRRGAEKAAGLATDEGIADAQPSPLKP